MSVIRINLKTDYQIDRKELIEFCLNNSSKQFVAIGWSCVYESENDSSINSYSDYYYKVKEYNSKVKKRMNPALNVFKSVEKEQLFWTRDLDGRYWLCRAIDSAKSLCIKKLDIGAVVPVKAYCVGLEVPGEIKASFNRPNGGTVERIHTSSIVEYSKYVYNTLSNEKVFEIDYNERGNLLDNLPDFELEELVISYLQIKKDYYVLSNSIANKSTTKKIECELISRNKEKLQKAVVQVKGKKAKPLDAKDFHQYIEDGYKVFLYAPEVKNTSIWPIDVIQITNDDLLAFYREYKNILPDSITRWENIFGEV